MITIERYRDAVRDEMGLLNAKVALSSFLETDKTEDKNIYGKFINQTLLFLAEKLQFTLGQERESLTKLREILESVNNEPNNEEIKKGLSELDLLFANITKYADDARNDYYRTFKRY